LRYCQVLVCILGKEGNLREKQEKNARQYQNRKDWNKEGISIQTLYGVTKICISF
jgi:hypothetical protein